jgi:hypothetical protein
VVCVRPVWSSGSGKVINFVCRVRVSSFGFIATTGFGCRVRNSPASPNAGHPILADELRTRHPNPSSVPFSGIRTPVPCGILAPELKLHAFVISLNSFRRSEQGSGQESRFVCEYRVARTRGSRRNGFPARGRSLARTANLHTGWSRSLARSKYACPEQNHQPAMLCIPQ